MAGLKRLPSILLLEPDGLVRGAVTSVCRDLCLAEVIQTVNCASALKALAQDPYQACILALTDGGTCMDILTQLRQGAFSCAADVPVALTASSIDAAIVARLKSLEVRRLLLKPFKVRDLVVTVETLLGTSAQTGALPATAPGSGLPDRSVRHQTASGSTSTA
ncbi:MAG: hypothetical protein R3E99_06660 [Burkholderiaceae bacterium]